MKIWSMTYPFDAKHNPWMFERDEIDVMEDELEELYAMHEHQDARETSMEHAVMKEQLDTEEMVEAELVLRFGPQMREEEHIVHEEDLSDTSISIHEMLQDHADRDPLYTQAYRWSMDVFSFAKDTYNRGTDRSRDMFRVYLNATLVPMKLSISNVEPCPEDHFAFHVIHKEYELALTYLERTLESLKVLVSRKYDMLIPFLHSGMALRQNLLLAIKHLGHGTSDPL